MCEKYDKGRVKWMIIVHDNHDGENMMPSEHGD